MRLFKARSALALGFAALLTVAPAHAQSATGAVPSRTGHTACVWARLPEDLRTKLMQYADTPANLADEIKPYLGDYNAASAACGVRGQLQIAPLRAFAKMRNIQGTFFAGANPDVVERAFLALPETARDQMTLQWLRRPYDYNIDSDLMKTTHLSMHGIAGSRVDDLWVNVYLELVAKLLFWEKHTALEGQNFAGVTACVYEALAPSLQGKAFSAAGDGLPVAPIVAAEPRALAYASQICLISSADTFVVGEEAKLAFLRRLVHLPSDKQWSDVDRAVAALPESDRAHLKTIFSAYEAPMSPEDIVFLDRTVFGVMRSVGGLGHFPDSPFPDYVRTYMTAKGHIDLYEGVGWP